VNTLVKQLNALPTVGYLAVPVPPVGGRSDLQKPCSRRVWWAREELNLRPLPCQQNGGNRCARSRSPRSPATVGPEGKRSVAVQLNALLACPDCSAETQHSGADVHGRTAAEAVNLFGCATLISDTASGRVLGGWRRGSDWSGASLSMSRLRRLHQDGYRRPQPIVVTFG
jgi:hypothetical protein